MGRWWDTNMASAGQALYTDPSMALETASVPDAILTGQPQMNLLQQDQQQRAMEKQYGAQKEEVQKKRSGFLGGILNAFDKADDVANSVSGGWWDKVQDNVLMPQIKMAWYPVDKIATGAHWLYSNAVSQNLSMLLLQAAKLDMGKGELFSAEDWGNAYHMAEHISPGQAFQNYENTVEATGDGTMLSGLFGAGADNLTKDERAAVKRNSERFLYDSDYWREKQGWTYTAGTGATDFFFVMFADPTTYLLGGASSAAKGARSVKYVEHEGQLVRDQGAIINATKGLAAKATGGKRGVYETPEDVANGEKMTKFFDWAAGSGANGASRKTQAEIAASPIFGRGRRASAARNQISAVLANTSREDMPLMYRFVAGDASAARELTAKGSGALDDIGRVSENRKLVDSASFDPALLAYFAEKEGVKAAEGAIKAPMVYSPEVVGLHEQAAKAVTAAKKGFRINANGMVSQAFAKNANQWKAAQVSLIDQELARTEGIGAMLRTALADNLGKDADQFSSAVRGAHLFGSLPTAYRMGTGTFRSSEAMAGRKFARQMSERTAKGAFSTEGFRKGFFGTPVRMLQAFGDKTPSGRINHNDADAGDRVFEMLREVPKLGAEQRSSLLNQYLTAGDKTAKSRALNNIHETVLNHMSQNVHGLDPEVADILNGMVRVGIESTVNKLAGKTVGSSRFGTKQAFSSATDDTGRTIDHVEDGVGWAVSPLAKTQLNQTDSLLPIREINRVLARNSGSIKKLRQWNGKAVDVARQATDGFNTIWKASTLLRPAYTARMVSEELAAAAIKFGFLSHIVAGGTEGTKNFVLNRAQYINAELGGLLPGKNLGSYSPTTGKGVQSRFSVVSLGDEDLVASVNARRSQLKQQIAASSSSLEKSTLQGQLDALKTTRIKVNKALPVVGARIKMEREAKSKIETELSRFTAKRDSIVARHAGKSTLPKRSQTALDQHNAKIADLEARMVDHDDVIDEFSQYSNYILNRALESTGRRVGEKSGIKYRGQEIHQPFSKAWNNPISRGQFDAEGEVAASAIYARAEAVDKERLMATGSWDYITPDQPQHMAEWMNAVNHQFAQDDGFRLVMEDSTGQKALEYFATPAGKQHLKDIGNQGKDPAKLVRNIGLTLDKYIPEHTGLRAKLLQGDDVTKADLQKAIPEHDFPIVHGQEVLDKTALWGRHQPGNILDSAIKKGFNRLGAIPSSIMSRNPVYVRFQEGRMKELIDNELRLRIDQGKSEHLTPDELNNLMRQSDKLARKDMSQIVYDPQRTTASEALRFIAPFYSAHADGLSRWAGLLAEKPEYIGKLARIYNAPVAANMITDDSGNLVNLNGEAEIRDPKTGKVLEKKFVPISDRVFQLKAPWADKSEGTTPIKLQAMNTILPGDPWWNPGTGPIVQIAGSQIAKASPTTGDFLQWAKIMPFGPSGSMTEAVTPKYMRSLWDAYRGNDPDNEAYQKAYLAIWNKKQMEYHETGKKFSTKDIENEAKQFMFLDFLEAWGSPAQTQSTPLTGSPYQFYVDQLSNYRKVYGPEANDRFVADFGSDYAGFTASLSKGMGIAASITADQQAEKYKDQIAADPDMAAFWVGDVYNGGAFSSSVYNKQFDQNFGAAKAREHIPAEHAIENQQVSTGWSDYRAAKGSLDSLLIRNGLKSYGEKGAEQLNAARAQLVSYLSAKYPAWGTAFNVTDRGKIPSRIRSFEMAIADDKLSQDPTRGDIPVLKEYLAGRQYFKQVLASRNLKQLSFTAGETSYGGGQPTGEAADVGYAWEQFKMSLMNKSIQFNDLYNRYLSSDDLQ